MTLRGHVAIARVDHWTKNVFVLPGVVIALSLSPPADPRTLLWRLPLALLAIGLVASSNYTINEIVDAPFDREHPVKRTRPVPSGEVQLGLGYFQWLALGAAGIAVGVPIGKGFVITLCLLWIMGVVYNIPPLRSKDIPYLDTLTEAINNPIRLVAGWFVVTDIALPPLLLILCYWMVGCFFMGIKRFAEAREIGDVVAAGRYRRSLGRVSPEQQLVAVCFYGSTAMLFFGAFIMRYRFELILSFPFVALVMAAYLTLGFRSDSAAQHPEKLYREPFLMASVIACAIVMTVLLLVDLPGLRAFFEPQIPGVRP